MKLEYIADNTASGKYPDAWPTKLIRLFDFDESQNQQLIELLTERLLRQRLEVELAEVSFISAVNCRLLLRLSDIDKGISEINGQNSFACDLTEITYLAAIANMHDVGEGHNWLDDASSEGIEFLYSAGGTW
ncbi:MAG TPA: hypothetical protein VFO93_07235 [Hymenobacter sp.]|uniref:hypothetical protein n=1 Tax=Hymenobacter sp. TaxID=1898978 RepID=UPI002D801719|nr:hypothetical protein [Hymenobacter sp.]HET9503316.1 hypothetical protein [Hymenobacter sp.]